jgi:site-specific DNA-methyltransferase (adenine-specific)
MSINLIELLNVDCMEYMKTCSNDQFDLAIVDPPYGINAPNMQMGTNVNRKEGGKGGTSVAVKLKKGRLNSGSGKLKNRALNTMNCEWDIYPPSPEYFIELTRVSKNQIIWGGNYFDLRPSRCIICWDKCQPWENFSQWEMAWTSFDKPAAMFRYSNTGGANREIKIHPTQKPLKLYEWLLDKYAKEGDRIIDTHGGSMNSMIACHYGGFNAVCCELDKDYFEAAQQRFDDQTRQKAMF